MTINSSPAPFPSATLGLTPGAVNIVLPRMTMTFDRSGHPRGLHENGYFIARGWDGRCVEKKWVAGKNGRSHRHLRELPPSERKTLRDRFLRPLTQLRRDLPHLQAAGRFQWLNHGQLCPNDPQALDALLAILESTVDVHWDADVQNFQHTYHPIGILPPDQYLSLVVQWVEGCAWNRCSFCTFYAERPARIKSPEELKTHMDNIERLFGPSLAGRCSLFIGEASAFDAPPSLLIPAARQIAARFPLLAHRHADGVGGLHAFGEATKLNAWSVDDLKELRNLGFQRIYIGVETGDDRLRRWIRKPGSPDLLVSVVERIKNAGIQVGLIFCWGSAARKTINVTGREPFVSCVGCPWAPGTCCISLRSSPTTILSIPID
jgi:hypothetical protein